MHRSGLTHLPPPSQSLSQYKTHQQTFCTAQASVTVHDKDCQDLVRSGAIGLGQLFRHLDRLPTFELIDAGYSDETGGLWRLYDLKCTEVSCRIREDFHPMAWDLHKISA